jgi:hypothetical protein
MNIESIIISFGSGFWWVLFLVISIFFGVYSSFLIFHWFRFSMNKPVALIASALYLGVGVLLLIILLGATINLI